MFVSKYAATYFSQRGYDVSVLNRNSRAQVEGVTLIEADRHHVKDALSGKAFDAVIDITAYIQADVEDFVPAISDFGTYVMISSSAVYPETEQQPFVEECTLGKNFYWGKYGTDKIAAEKQLLEMVPDAYIIRPPYLYGPMNNVYREAFVFDCAMANRKFYLPKDGGMKLQFFHVRDLCRVIEKIIETKPLEHIYNVGNESPVTIRNWVELCYKCAHKEPEFVHVSDEIEQRKYFSFYNYEYLLDVEKQKALLGETTDLTEGLQECFEWYQQNRPEVIQKPLIQFIDDNLACDGGE